MSETQVYEPAAPTIWYLTTRGYLCTFCFTPYYLWCELTDAEMFTTPCPHCGKCADPPTPHP